MRGELDSTLMAHYSRRYLREGSDSPLDSRVSIVRRFRQSCIQTESLDYVLDIGSGPQTLYSHIKVFGLPPNSKFVSIDSATIPKKKLLASKIGAEHVRANGISLPFPTSHFEAIISNLAMDFLGKTVYREIKRILKPNGKLIMNLQHPILREIYELQLTRLDELKPGQKRVLELWRDLLAHQMLFDCEDEIEKTLKVYGFQPNRIVQGSERSFSFSSESVHVAKWWEVDAYAI